MWFTTTKEGVFKYDGKEFNSYLKKRGKLMPDSLHHNVVLSIVENGNGDIWFSSFSHGGISQYNKNGFVHHSLKDGFGNGMISSLYCDRKDTIWVASYARKGVYQYDGKSFTPFKIKKTTANQVGKGDQN